MGQPKPQLHSTKLYCRSIYHISSETTEYFCTRAATPFAAVVKLEAISYDLLIVRSRQTETNLQVHMRVPAANTLRFGYIR
jgi:hypothetical protein